MSFSGNKCMILAILQCTAEQLLLLNNHESGCTSCFVSPGFDSDYCRPKVQRQHATHIALLATTGHLDRPDSSWKDASAKPALNKPPESLWSGWSHLQHNPTQSFFSWCDLPQNSNKLLLRKSFICTNMFPT